MGATVGSRFQPGVQGSSPPNVTIFLEPNQEIATLLNEFPDGHFIFPNVAPGQEPTLTPTLLTAGDIFSPTFEGFSPRGGLPDPVAGVVTLPAEWYALRILTPDSSADRVTWIDPLFRNLALTSPLKTTSAYVGPAGFIWGRTNLHIVMENVAAIDMGFPVCRATGGLSQGILLKDYSHLTSVGNTSTSTVPSSGTTYTADLSGVMTYTYNPTAGSGAATVIITGPRGTHTATSTATSGVTGTDTIAVQKGGVYTLSGTAAATFDTGSITSASSPAFITPMSLDQDGGVIEFQGFSTLVFAAQGCYVGSDGQGSDNTGVTLGAVTVRNLKIFAQDVYSSDAAFDMECGTATTGWDFLAFNVELHNAKFSNTNCNSYRIVQCWHEFNLTGTGPTPLFRTYQSTTTQGFGTLLIRDTVAIQRPTLGATDSSQMVLVTGSSNSGTTPFHADEVRIENCTFIVSGNATGGNLVSPINIDPANAAAQPIDRVILRNNRYGYSGKTPAAAKPFYLVGYGGATGGTYTSSQLVARGLIAIGAAAANGRYPQTFAGAQTQYGLSVNPDGNTVTIMTLDWGDFDFKAISAPTGNILLGAGTTVSNYGTLTFGGYGPTLITNPATGDILIYNGTNWTNLAVGTSLQALLGGTTPAWVNVPQVVAATQQKAETGAADASVLSFVCPAVAGQYELKVFVAVSAATSGVIGFTIAYVDANGHSTGDEAFTIFRTTVSAGALTITVSAQSNYWGQIGIDTDNSGGTILLKWVGGGTTTAKVSAILLRVR